MGFYAESYDRPNQSAIAQEDIHVGLAVSKTGAGQVNLVDDVDTSADGVALAPRTAEYIALDEDVDQLHEYTYDAADNDRVVYASLEEAGAVFKLRTITDNATDPAPAISDGDIVGVAHKADGSFRGRIVEEGYTDNGATTYDNATGNFTEIGVAKRDESSSFDEPVRIEVTN